MIELYHDNIVSLLMNFFEALILGVIQGISEFLPISSSGHLIVAEQYMHLPVADLQSFDVAVHFGTLLTIFVYFRKDIGKLLIAFGQIIVRKAPEKEEKSLIGYLILGTIPAVLVGLFFNDFLKDNFRNTGSVAFMLIVVAIYFVVAEIVKRRRKVQKIGLFQAVLIGCAQAVALIPGVSRSGITIATGLVQGVRRDEAARFSFLLGSVAITAATVLSVFKVMKGEFLMPSTPILITGIASSFVAGYAAVSLLMRFLKSHPLHVFAIYRILLAVVILSFF